MGEPIKIKSLDEIKQYRKFLEDKGKTEKIDSIKESIFSILRKGPTDLPTIKKDVKEIAPVADCMIEESLQKLIDQHYIRQFVLIDETYTLTKDGKKFWKNYEDFYKSVEFLWENVRIIVGGFCGEPPYKKK